MTRGNWVSVGAFCCCGFAVWLVLSTTSIVIQSLRLAATIQWLMIGATFFLGHWFAFAMWWRTTRRGMPISVLPPNAQRIVATLRGFAVAVEEELGDASPEAFLELQVSVDRFRADLSRITIGVSEAELRCAATPGRHETRKDSRI